MRSSTGSAAKSFITASELGPCTAYMSISLVMSLHVTSKPSSCSLAHATNCGPYSVDTQYRSSPICMTITSSMILPSSLSMVVYLERPTGTLSISLTNRC